MQLLMSFFHRVKETAPVETLELLVLLVPWAPLVDLGPRYLTNRPP